MGLNKKHGKRRRNTKSSGPAKRRKLGPESLKNRKRIEHGRDIIPIPERDDEVELSDQDLDVLEEYGHAASFLDKLDRNGISKSKNETDRLHRLNRPIIQKPIIDDDLPSVDSHDDDGELWSSGIDESLSEGGDSLLDDSEHQPSDSDEEMAYEKVPRKQKVSRDDEKKSGIRRLPIKLPDGRIQETGRIAVPPSDFESDSSSDESSDDGDGEGETRNVEDVSTGARFGRPSVIDVVGTKSRIARIQAAKEQIAGICQEILADPENSLGLLKRLHTFSLAKISTPNHPDPVINDILIRKLSVLSQLAVYKDIIPGYRIRPLTDKEKAEKVSQMVGRTREWEQGLVTVYQSYIRSLEAELKAKSELADACLQCICTLAVEATHFNCSVDVMNCIVSRMCKKSWDKSSDRCLDTLINVFRADHTGSTSLEVVRLLNRTIKERRFNVHPKTLACLLHLRLKTELNVRASESKADKGDGVRSYSKKRAAERRAKGKATGQPHLTKNMKKALKEKKVIDKEFREAEAEVDKEERATTHTETLKLIFVLYFKILKSPKPTRLLPAALQGISKYAHLVNIDFFQDLMQVLKDLISRESERIEGEEEGEAEAEVLERFQDGREVQHPLLCIVTAFELLTGQGEALNIDLTDFINRLYAIMLPLSLMSNIEAPLPNVSDSTAGGSGSGEPSTVADLLFRALDIAFAPRSLGGSTAPPPWRSAAFAKRMLIGCMQWPARTALRALEFVGGLVQRDAKLEALVGTNPEDRSHDGIYRPDIDDPQLCYAFGTTFWELHVLGQSHMDDRVREVAGKLAKFTRS